MIRIQPNWRRVQENRKSTLKRKRETDNRTGQRDSFVLKIRDNIACQSTAGYDPVVEIEDYREDRQILGQERGWDGVSKRKSLALDRNGAQMHVGARSGHGS